MSTEPILMARGCAPVDQGRQQRQLVGRAVCNGTGRMRCIGLCADFMVARWKIRRVLLGRRWRTNGTRGDLPYTLSAAVPKVECRMLHDTTCAKFAQVLRVLLHAGTHITMGTANSFR